MQTETSTFVAGFAFGLPVYTRRSSVASLSADILMYHVKTEDGTLFQRIEARTDSEALRRARLFGRRLFVHREDGALVGIVNEES
jgi:hypothetical protein